MSRLMLFLLLKGRKKKTHSFHKEGKKIKFNVSSKKYNRYKLGTTKGHAHPFAQKGKTFAKSQKNISSN